MFIGKIGAAHGIHGEVKLFPLSDVPGRFQNLKRVFWIGPKAEARTLQVAACRAMDRFYLVAFEGIETREQASGLTNGHLALPRQERGSLPSGQYFVDDIVGMEVVGEDGKSFGRVAAVWQTGSNDVYEVRGPEGERMLPAVQGIILRIDLAERRMIVRPPDEA
ncbi:MAG: ribosome maturation factor RimM [candidate division FCPU426 bacterium]